MAAAGGPASVGFWLALRSWAAEARVLNGFVGWSTRPAQGAVKHVRFLNSVVVLGVTDDGNAGNDGVPDCGGGGNVCGGDGVGTSVASGGSNNGAVGVRSSVSADSNAGGGEGGDDGGSSGGVPESSGAEGSCAHTHLPELLEAVKTGGVAVGGIGSGVSESMGVGGSSGSGAGKACSTRRGSETGGSSGGGGGDGDGGGGGDSSGRGGAHAGRDVGAWYGNCRGSGRSDGAGGSADRSVQSGLSTVMRGCETRELAMRELGRLAQSAQLTRLV